MSREYKIWTPSQERKLIKMLKRLDHYKDIAAHFKCKYATIGAKAHYLRKLGKLVQPKRVKKVKPKGTGGNGVLKRVWTDKELKYMHEANADKTPRMDMAKVLNCSQPTLIKKLRELGLADRAQKRKVVEIDRKPFVNPHPHSYYLKLAARGHVLFVG